MIDQILGGQAVTYAETKKPPATGLHSEIAGNVQHQLGLASDARRTLVELRARIFGPVPEAASAGNQKSAAPSSFADHIREGHDALTATLAWINEAVNDLSGRL